MKKKLIFIITLFIFMGTSMFSQESNKEDDEKEKRDGTANTEFIDLKERKDWSFKVAPYAWMGNGSNNWCYLLVEYC